MLFLMSTDRASAGVSGADATTCASSKLRGRSSSPTLPPPSPRCARAGVGIAALYHRYPSKNALLAQLCLDGQDTYIELVEKALASIEDPWTAYVQWLRDIVAADTHALTVHLAGHFIPDERHAARTEQMIKGTVELFERASRPARCAPD